MQKHADDCQERYGSTKTTNERNNQGSPTAHHHIAAQSANSVDLYQWVYADERQGDPALKVRRVSPCARRQPLTCMQNFVPKLKDHILTCLLHQGDATTTRSFSSEEQTKLIILQDKLYFHSTMAVNYTTYDGRRESETLNPRTHADIMTLSQGDTHPYKYSRILGIFRVKVMHPSLGSKAREVDMLWVRSYEFDNTYRAGWEARRFYRVHFTNSAGGDAFGFLDPQDVLRAAHLLPGFRYGRTQALLPRSLARWKSEGDEDWACYHVNM